METKKQTPKIELSKHLQDHWSAQEKENVAVVVDFFQHLMNEHDFEYTLQKYGNTSYIQDIELFRMRYQDLWAM